MHHLGSHLIGSVRDVARAKDVDAVGLVAVLLAGIDAGLGGTVDHDGGLELQRRTLDRQAVSDVALHMRQAGHIVQRGQPIHELHAQAPACTHHEDRHVSHVPLTA